MAWRQVQQRRRQVNLMFSGGGGIRVETCPVDWLVEPLALDAVEAKLGRHASHPNWLRVKRLAKPGDEFWSFRSPPDTWPNKVGAAGYALVRAGVPVACFTIMRS